MDILGRKSGNAYTFVPPEAPLQHDCPARRRFGRMARILLIVVAVAVTLGLHVSRYRFYASDRPEILVPPAPATMSKEFDWKSLEPSTEIKWTPCDGGHQCARLLLPLDYLSSDPDGPTTAIALRLVPARDHANYRGTILVNPGGPGGSGTFLARYKGDDIATVVGGSYDILGFDPRGVGESTPRLDCFVSKSQRDIWVMQEGHQLLNASDDAVLGLYKARHRALGERCSQTDGGEDGIARFMGTASVATDMLKITEKLGQEKLNYWGFSYGTVLGQYFAAMYPDKIGRFVIDGVFDAENYRLSLWSSNLIDNQEVIESLFTYCHKAGPLKCAIYEPTPAAIRERYHRVLDAVRLDPISVSLAEPPVLLTHKVLISQLFFAAYAPVVGFPLVVNTVRAIETADQAALIAIAQGSGLVPSCNCGTSPPPAPLSQHVNDALPAISCGDADEAPYDRDEYRAFFDALVREAPTTGPIWAGLHLGCTQWPLRAKWRFTGPLAARNTSNPILILQPRLDPATPLRDAIAVRERFPGAKLLVQDSHGHCTLSVPSVCTAKVARRFFEEGVAPKEFTVCEPDELPFVGKTSEVKAMEEEDRELFDALRSLSEAVPMFAPPSGL